MTRRLSLPPWLARGSIVAAVLLVYAVSLRAPFVAGDLPGIVHNASLRGGWREWLDGPEGFSVVLARPVLNVTFALNYAVGRLDVAGYHAVNLLIHVGNALLLYGIIRRTRARSEGFAWGCALLWAIHPLQTEAVTHLAQRAESLMTFWLFFTLYGFIRGAAGGRGWLAASVAACLLGMGTHEDMVSAPFIVMLFDRTFLAPSWREVWRRRGGWQLAYLGTLLGAAWLGYRYHSRGHTYGFGAVPWLRYAGAAYPAFAHYLFLTVWPHPLVLGYGNHYLASGWELLPGAMWFALFTLLAVSTFHRPTAVSFLAVAFLELLEPTSVVPHLHETLAEHRMYPALAPLLIGLVWAIQSAAVWLRDPRRSYLDALRSNSPWALSGRWSYVLVIVALGVALGAVTAARNAVYRWQPERLGGIPLGICRPVPLGMAGGIREHVTAREQAERFDLLSLPVFIAAQFGGEQPGDCWSGLDGGGGVEQQGAGAAGQHIFDRPGHFHPGVPRDLALLIGQ